MRKTTIWVERWNKYDVRIFTTGPKEYNEERGCWEWPGAGDDSWLSVIMYRVLTELPVPKGSQLFEITNGEHVETYVWG